jgi:hypothetical protein
VVLGLNDMDSSDREHYLRSRTGRAAAREFDQTHPGPTGATRG